MPLYNQEFVNFLSSVSQAAVGLTCLSVPKTQSTTERGLFTGDVKGVEGLRSEAQAPDFDGGARLWGKSYYHCWGVHSEEG